MIIKTWQNTKYRVTIISKYFTKINDQSQRNVKIDHIRLFLLLICHVTGNFFVIDGHFCKMM